MTNGEFEAFRAVADALDPADELFAVEDRRSGKRLRAYFNIKEYCCAKFDSVSHCLFGSNTRGCSMFEYFNTPKEWKAGRWRGLFERNPWLDKMAGCASPEEILVRLAVLGAEKKGIRPCLIRNWS